MTPTDAIPEWWFVGPSVRGQSSVVKEHETMSPNPGEPEHNERGWTHAICGPCWDRRHPDRGPVTVSEDDPEVCCYCGATTNAGIYVRDNPQIVHATQVSA